MIQLIMDLLVIFFVSIASKRLNILIGQALIPTDKPVLVGGGGCGGVWEFFVFADDGD
jgi:hypothetical protein